MEHQSYVLLCSKITSFPLSKVKFFQNPSCHILEKINKNYDKKLIFGYCDALKIYGAPKLCTVM